MQLNESVFVSADKYLIRFRRNYQMHLKLRITILKNDISSADFDDRESRRNSYKKDRLFK